MHVRRLSALTTAVALVATALAAGPSAAAPDPTPQPAPERRTVTAEPAAPVGDRGDLEELAPPAPEAPRAADQVLVRFAERASDGERRSALGAAGVAGGADGQVPGTDFVAVPTGDEDPEAVAAELADDPRVAEVQVDHVRRTAGWTNDPLIGRAAPYLDLVRLPRAWETGTGAGVVVAVVDTGVSDHEDLAGVLLPGIDLVEGDTDVFDMNGHGTLVAGAVAAQGGNRLGAVGAAHDASVLPVRVLDTFGEGYDSDIAEGITWAAQNGADVINLSLGGSDPSPVLLAAIRSAVAAGAVVVAASGNESIEAPGYPAAYAPEVDGLVAVTATDDAGAVTSFSTTGDWVSLAAPGVQIVGPWSGGGYTADTGTSFAAPLVSGAAALVRGHEPRLTPAEVEQRLVSTARDAGPKGVDPYYGAGVLDAAAAVTAGDARRAAVAVPLDRAPAEPAGATNDSVDTATALGPDAATLQPRGALTPEGDVDWFRVDARRGWYEIRVDVAGGTDPHVEVRDGAGRVLGLIDGVGYEVTARVRVPVAAAGPLLVGVRQRNGAATSDPYRLRVAQVSDPASPDTAPTGTGWLRGVDGVPHASGGRADGQARRVTFERPLDPASIGPDTVRLADALTGAPVAATPTYETTGGRVGVLTVTPAQELAPGGHYRLDVTGVRDAAGATLPTPVRTWFTVGAGGDRFTPIDPVRVLDTRVPDDSGWAAPLAPDERLMLSLAGGVPADATAVVLSLTATRANGHGNVRVFPATNGFETPVPLVSNLNVVRGVDQPNLATVQLGQDQSILLMTEGMTTDVIVDVYGWYTPGGATGYEPVTPTRVLDTRDGTGVRKGAVTGGRWVDLQVAGRAGVPADATAVVLNVVGTQVTGRTFVSAYPRPDFGPDGPTTSSLNLYPGRDQANLVTVKVGEGGQVRFWVDQASTHLVADLAGYYTATGSAGFVPVAPQRVADSRSGLGFPGRLQAGRSVDLRLAGSGLPVPASARAAVVNVTGVGAADLTHIRAFPTTVPATLPEVSSINLVRGRDEANLAVLPVGDGGRTTFYSHTAATDLVVDVSGYFRTYR
ncbi:S8 family serine peptidase [Cellulomonas sp. 179-A 9B4 NHS]|uniref:S8 family serine peptidase n=1 Tax=Cellulomonas sp. 179-A 9B4 NHS TaxID=3142379 RepID=UPI0039A1CFAB